MVYTKPGGKMAGQSEAKQMQVELSQLRAELEQLRNQVTHLERPGRAHIHTDHPHVVRIEGVHGGRPTVRGTGVSVQTIVEQTRLGRLPEQIVDDYEGVL